MPLTQVDPSVVRLGGRRKAEALAELIGAVPSDRAVPEPLARVRSTVIDRGIAVARVAARGFAVVVGLSQEGIDFGAWDGSPVRVVFLIAAPAVDEGRRYAEVLAQVFRMIAREDVSERLLAAPGAEAVIAALRSMSSTRPTGREAEVEAGIPLAAAAP